MVEIISQPNECVDYNDDDGDGSANSVFHSIGKAKILVNLLYIYSLFFSHMKRYLFIIKVVLQ